MEKQLIQLVEENREHVIALRRHFHMHPELGGEEFDTQQKILEELKALGLTPRASGGTGVIADIRGGRPGRTVAIRADIDALPIQDEIDQPYRSQIAGRCHACGHDGHTAMLLGLARVFTALRSELPGTIRLLFQPSEERFPGGAHLLIADGALDGVDAVLGAHLWQPVPVGEIGIAHGPLMASPGEFAITVQGRGGHGSMPHQTIDPIYVGAQLVVALRSIVGNDISSNDRAVISFGAFQAGEVFNIIPDTATLKGTIRIFSTEVRDRILERFHQICKGVCLAAGADYSLYTNFGFPAVINHPAVSAVLAESGREALGEEGVRIIDPVMGGEDFSRYQEVVPGAFVFIGAGNESKGIVYPQHHPKYDIDEAALSHGVAVMGLAALKLLHKVKI